MSAKRATFEILPNLAFGGETVVSSSFLEKIEAGSRNPSVEKLGGSKSDILATNVNCVNKIKMWKHFDEEIFFHDEFVFSRKRGDNEHHEIIKEIRIFVCKN